MYEVKAYLRHALCERVVEALEAIDGVTGVAVVMLNEFGHRPDGVMEAVDRVKLELYVAETALADAVVETILQHGRSGEGHIGDGRIFVSRIDRAIRIRDGMEGPEGLRPEAGR
jgi:nitrogen regulatory protein P-II 1